MAIFAIGDLHLSFGEDKPMAIFGEAWHQYEEKIKKDWTDRVGPEDTVIIPGDISWAMHFETARVDLEWIDALPGNKILFKGNHDYWWASLTKMTGVYKTLKFVHNSFESVGDVAICGTRGWLSPNGQKFDENDERIYKREAIRLENSLKMAKAAGFEKIIGVLHYPPTNELKEPSLFTELMTSYGVSDVVFGHVHSEPFFKMALQGPFHGVLYHLTACDYLDFKLLRVMD